jgi:hypothetical protein
MVAVDDNGGILAYMGVQPRPYRTVESTVPSGEMTTWVVHRDVRNRGLGIKVLHALQERYPVLYGSSPSREGAPLFLRAGFRVIPAVPRYVRILDPEALEDALALEGPERKLIRARQRDIPEPGEVTVEDIPAADLPAADSGLQGPVRSRDYLAWRYDRHPVYAYRAFRLETDGGPAGVVLRMDQTPSLRVLHIVEVTGPLSAMPQVVCFTERFAREHGIQLADISCTTDAVTYAFRAAGWFSVLEDPVRLPHLFYPLEMRSPASSGLLLWTRLADPMLWKASSLYMTKGDIDMDRPTQNYFDAHAAVPGPGPSRG